MSSQRNGKLPAGSDRGLISFMFGRHFWLLDGQGEWRGIRRSLRSGRLLQWSKPGMLGDSGLTAIGVEESGPI